MRGKESQLQTDHDEYGYQDMSKSKFRSKPRLDLNDLLQRVKDQKKQQKKLNLLIFSGAASLAAVVILILNL